MSVPPRNVPVSVGKIPKDHLKISKIGKFCWQKLKNLKNIDSRSLRIFVDICVTYGKSYHFRILNYTRYIVFDKIDFILYTDIARTRNASPHSGEYICRRPRNAI